LHHAPVRFAEDAVFGAGQDIEDATPEDFSKVPLSDRAVVHEREAEFAVEDRHAIERSLQRLLKALGIAPGLGLRQGQLFLEAPDLGAESNFVAVRASVPPDKCMSND
jgi:hypothetical protein